MVKTYALLAQAKARVAYQQYCPIGELLTVDEGAHLEYKSTLRTSTGTGEVVKALETAVIKTVAAFANSRDGGTLLIGVADDGTVNGLDTDYASIHKPGKDNRDLFGLHLTQILINAIGEATASSVSTQLHTVDTKDLCRVHVPPSPFPVEANVKVDKGGKLVQKTAFYIRIGNGTREVTDPGEKQKYIASRWGTTVPSTSTPREEPQ